MTVELIQFLRPDGREEKVFCDDFPDELKSQYDAIGAAGCRLTGEMLVPETNIALCIEHPKAGDIAIEVVPNGPKVLDALAKLIREFDPKNIVSPPLAHLETLEDEKE